MFDFMMPIMFIAFIIIFVFAIVNMVGTWHKNNKSPRLIVPAKIVSKRESTTHHNHAAGDQGFYMTTDTTYYVTFQFESGDRMELAVSGSEYRMLTEGSEGKLTFQGTRYLSFDN